MILATDVHYAQDQAFAAGIMFDDWSTDHILAQHRVPIESVAAYEPGAFYKRELPCLLALMESLARRPAVVLVDGYVWLGAGGRDGLGAHLFRALEEKVPVIGVAKTEFRGTPKACQLLRGASTQPLFVTAAGMALGRAKSAIAALHGPYRIPTMLAAVDRLARHGPGTHRPGDPGS